MKRCNKKLIVKIMCLFFAMIFLVGCQSKKTDAPEKELEQISDPARKQDMKELMSVLNREMEKILVQAKASLVQGNMDETIRILQKAKEISPVDFRPYLLLSEIYFRAGQDSLGFKELEEATQSNAHTDILIGNVFSLLQEIRPSEEPPEDLPGISVAQFRDDKRCAVSFHFDDGTKYVYTKIMPIFEEFGFKATIPINPGIVPEDEMNPWWGTWKNWQDAHARGFEIANHTINHTFLPDISDELLEKEVNGGQEIITQKIGKSPLSFVFPFDKFDETSLRKVSEQHVAIRVHDYLSQVYENVFIPAYGGVSMYESTGEKIIDLAIQEGIWLIPESHSVEGGGIKTYKPMTVEFLRAHLEYIKEHEDEIWVDTFINVYCYLAEKRSANIDLQEKKDKSLIFTLTTGLNPQIFSVPLTVVINTDPYQPTAASATVGEGQAPLDVKIKKKQLFVDVVPGIGPVYVEWE